MTLISIEQVKTPYSGISYLMHAVRIGSTPGQPPSRIPRTSRAPVCLSESVLQDEAKSQQDHQDGRGKLPSVIFINHNLKSCGGFCSNKGEELRSVGKRCRCWFGLSWFIVNKAFRRVATQRPAHRSPRRHRQSGPRAGLHFRMIGIRCFLRLL